MNMLNSLILEGDVTRGLELKSGFADFEVTNKRYYQKPYGSMKEEENVFTVELYGNQIERFKTHLVTGRGVRIVGLIKQRKEKDEAGVEHSRVVIVAEHIEFKRYKSPEERAEEAPETQEAKA